MTHYEQQTQFGKEVDEALGTAGAVVGTAAVLGAVGVRIGAGLTLAGDDDDDDDCHDYGRLNHHRRHRD